MTAEQIRELAALVRSRAMERIPESIRDRIKVEDRSGRGYLYIRFVFEAANQTFLLLHARSSIRKVTPLNGPTRRTDHLSCGRVGDVRIFSDRGTMNRRRITDAIDRTLEVCLPGFIGKIDMHDLVDGFDLAGKVRVSRHTDSFDIAINDVSEDELERFIRAIPSIFKKERRVPAGTGTPMSRRPTAWERISLDD